MAGRTRETARFRGAARGGRAWGSQRNGAATLRDNPGTTLAVADGSRHVLNPADALVVPRQTIPCARANPVRFPPRYPTDGRPAENAGKIERKKKWLKPPPTVDFRTGLVVGKKSTSHCERVARNPGKTYEQYTAERLIARSTARRPTAAHSWTFRLNGTR